MPSSSSSSSTDTSSSSTMLVAAAAVTSTVVMVVTVAAAGVGLTLWYQQQLETRNSRDNHSDKLMSEEEKRKQRSKWIEAEIEQQEEARQEDQVLPSIISNFHTFQLDYGTTIEEANKKRTQKYYQMARDAHKYDLVPRIPSYPRLRNKREVELARIYRYANSNKSHRTVIVMCDSFTQQLLEEARTYILQPLDYSHDIATPEVWIPSPNIIPMEHLHVTIAIPWWWHGIRDNNEQLSRELVARFRQALITEFHHPFQIELERIVLLGGKTLVGLWRTVGERKATPQDDDGQNPEFVIFDRHGEKQDPLVKLRRDIVECFTAQNNPYGQQPLTYFHRHYSDNNADDTKEKDKKDTTPTPTKPEKKQEQQQHRPSENTSLRDTAAAIAEANAEADAEEEEEVTTTPPPVPPPLPRPQGPPKRRNTIELKTPGLGDRDGFIHTTLARLPIDCLSMTDVELEPIHRLCREATATYCGHRMVVSRFRFLETTGIGGESDPCEQPIFDEYVDAPAMVEIAGNLSGEVQQLMDLHATKLVDRSATIGNLPPVNSTANILDAGLFEQPQPTTILQPNPLDTKASST